MSGKRKKSPRTTQGALTAPGRAPRDAAARSRKQSGGRSTPLRPVTLTEGEAEAIVTGLAIASQEDPGLVESARSAVAKLVEAGGAATRARLARAGSNAARPQPADWDEMLAIVEDAIRDERELRISYEDQAGYETTRVIRPLAFAESRSGESVAAWCALRRGFRHFRLDRVLGIVALESFFKGERDRLLDTYMESEDPH